MYFQHAEAIRSAFPGLAAMAITSTGITPDADVDEPVARFTAIAKGRLAGGSESDLLEIKAWRQAFSKMGLKPTQYRCARRPARAWSPSRSCRPSSRSF